MIKIAIIGSREYPDLIEVEEYLNSLKKLLPCMAIVTGGAPGVDKVAENWALGWGIDCEVIRPIEKNIGYGIKMNYIFRNIEIISNANQVVAFWDEQSTGTKLVIDYCKLRGKFIMVKRCQGKLI